MLKKRIVGVVIVKDEIAVQSIGFESYLPIGKPEIIVEYLNEWGIDEVIFLDISATRNNNGPNFSTIEKISEKCMVPLTIGGGISNIDQIHKLMRCGADKVSLNRAIHNKSDFIKEAVEVFGSQCIVASIDVKLVDDKYYSYDYLKKENSKNNLLDKLSEINKLGIGEIYLNNVDKDGLKNGYDIELIKYVLKNVEVPVICCGGAGNPNHILEVIKKTKVEAIAAANFFNFFEHSVAITKSYIMKEIELRNDSTYNYLNINFFNNGRIKKKDEDFLEKMLYKKIENEEI